MTLTALLHWWGGQLARLLPPGLKGDPNQHDRLTCVTLVSTPEKEPVTLAIALPAKRRGPALPSSFVTLDSLDSQALGSARRARVRLCLPRGRLLEREVVLPLAAETAPEQVIQFEFDRLTPFKAEETFWTCRLLRRDRSRGKLHLRLTFTPRSDIGPVLNALTAAGAVVERLESADADEATRRTIPLGTALTNTERRRLRFQLGACGALAVATIIVPFVRQSLVLSEMEERITELQPAVAEATALRHRMAASGADGDVIEAERRRLGEPMQALAAVTEALPDDTWITDFSLRQRHLTIAGRSGGAVRLIARLAAEPALRSPAFTAPVTRAENGRNDQFSIAAELLP